MNGFAWRQTKDGRVRISRGGRLVMTLAGEQARAFIRRAERADGDAAQQLMARATGNYKHGYERS